MNIWHLIFLLLIGFNKNFAWSAEQKGLLPEIANDEQKSFQSEVMITQTENKAIESLKKIIKRKLNTPEEADLLFRLAELYMRRSKSGRYFELEPGSAYKLRQFGLADQKTAEFLKQALQIYGDITRKFPQFPELDYVLFNSALAHIQIKETEKSKKNYTSLIEKFPHSALVPDALLELGEIYYNQQNFSMALKQFLMINQYPQSRAYPYGVYKSAWCYYNLKDTAKGIQQLLSVVQQNPATSSDEKKYNLRKEALRDLTLFVGETLAPDQVYTFFEKITVEAELGEIMLALADLYESHSRYKEISIFTSQYIEKHPHSPQASKCYTKMIETNETLKKRDLVLQNLEAMGSFCKKETTDANCGSEFKKVSLDISKKWWDIWLKNKLNSEFSALTRKAFENLLSLDTDSIPDSNSRYAFAELLFQQEDYAAAEQNYEKVSLQMSAPIELRHDALYAALFSTEKLLEKKESTEMTEKQKQLSLRYLNEYKNGDHADEVQYKLAYIAYRQQQYETALFYSSALVAKTKDSALKIKAEDLRLDIYNIKKDYKSLQSLAQNIVANKPSLQRKTNMLKISEEAQYAQVQLDVKDLSTEKQITSFVNFSNNHSSSQLGQQAYWQSISLAYAKDLDSLGADLSMKYVEAYPTDIKNTDALKEAVKSYLESGHIKSALAALKLLSAYDKANWMTHTELICNLLQMEIHTEESRNCYKDLIAKTNSQKKIEYQIKLLKSYPDQQSIGFLEIQNQIFNAGIEPYTTQILIQKAKTLLQNKDYTQAFALSLKINARNVDADMRAEARLIQAHILENEFNSQSIKASESRLALVLAMKTEKLDKAFTAYSSAIKMSKSPTLQLEGLQGIDRLYTQFIFAVDNISLSDTMSAADKQALKHELTSLAQPFNEKLKSNRLQMQSLAQLGDNTIKTVNWEELGAQLTVAPLFKFPEFNRLHPYFLRDEISAEVKQFNQLYKAQKMTDAETKALEISSHKSSRPQGLYCLSLIADSRQQFEKSLWLVEKSLALKASVEGAFQKAKVVYSVEGFNTASTLFEKLLSENNLNSDLQIILALKFLSDGDYKKSLAEFSRLSKEQIYNYGMSTLHIESVLLSGDTAGALKLIEDYRKYKTLDLELNLAEARIYESFLTSPQKAATFYQKALLISKQTEQKEWLKRKLDFLKQNKSNQITSYVGGS
jgi:cellulose synthase operon protein C